MNIAHLDPPAMTAEEFFDFTASRPAGEKWELIEGEPVLSPSANDVHQRIIANLVGVLRSLRLDHSANWIAIPGIGVEISPSTIPIPDVLVRPAALLDDWKCDDMIVAFEILSPSSADRDLRWKRKAYARLASLEHYVVAAQDAFKIIVYDRQTGFAERCIEGKTAHLELPALGIVLPFAEIYRDTGLDRK
ncbi:MAG TPA: Uma2 family endonuclease [Methylovirgula sp.]|nr:Uma2 family endonuclease [Methylovirgula sp.]